MKAFLITLTGPSMSGKTYVMNKIEEQQRIFPNSFYPIRISKYTTRSYRLEEIRQKNKGEHIDVESVARIPENCDLVYRTYGKYYGISLQRIRDLLEKGKSPIIIINDVRVVEELKAAFPNKVLSLFLFRKIPEMKDFRNISSKRGNIAIKESRLRYEKAVSIYRTYIENITLFDRVILNVKDYHGRTDEIDYTGLQIHNVIRGVLEGRILLGNSSESNSKKMFIISGGSQSGKDEIIRSVNELGKLQAYIIPKYTTRMQEAGDGPDMICKYIPKKSLLDKLKKEYENEYEIVSKKNLPTEDFINDLREKYNEETDKQEAFEDYLSLNWEARRLDSLRKVKTVDERFWEQVEHRKSELKKQKKKSVEITNRVKLEFFQENDKYIDIENILEVNKLQFEEYTKNHQVGVTGPACYIVQNDDGYILYKNNADIIYAFRIKDKNGGILGKMQTVNRHSLIAASLTEIFRLCREHLSNEVVTIFAYSQISVEQYQKKTSEITAMKKANSARKDLERYSKYIEFFDHVSIYAKDVYNDTKGGAEEELIDQIFRIFRAYN